MSGENKPRPEVPREDMEQRLSDWIEELHRRAPESIGDLLRFRVGPCNPEEGRYCFHVSTEQWMKNAFGSLHGGIISTIMDQGMGMLATCLMNGTAITPTVQMNISYHHPMMPGDKVLLKIYVESITRTLMYMRAEAMKEDQPDRLCVTASGVFFAKML